MRERVQQRLCGFMMDLWADRPVYMQLSALDEGVAVNQRFALEMGEIGNPMDSSALPKRSLSKLSNWPR